MFQCHAEQTPAVKLLICIHSVLTFLSQSHAEHTPPVFLVALNICRLMRDPRRSRYSPLNHQSNGANQTMLVSLFQFLASQLELPSSSFWVMGAL